MAIVTDCIAYSLSRQSTQSARLRSASVLSHRAHLLGSSFRDDKNKAEETWSWRLRSTWRRVAHGWRAGTIICAMTAGIVFLINLVMIVWASAKYPVNDGLGTIQQGSCSKTRIMNTWLHLAINILSTVLLSASNYCMQILSAPTRQEVDQAHMRARWLDIGVPSIRNLRSISR